MCRTGIYKKEAVGRDLISVIFFAHSNTLDGRIRSRGFYSLNKKAKLVSKVAIIIVG